jgi:hypothetical protein
MSFSIDFVPGLVPDLERGEDAVWGEIQLGDHRERFIASLGFWSKSDYLANWRRSLSRIIHSARSSALITSITDPAQSNFLTWWPIYRLGDDLCFQQQYLGLNSLTRQFDPKDPYEHVPPRVTLTADGQKISEWRIPLEAARSFLVDMRPG